MALRYFKKTQRGMSLIEVLFAAALLLVVFGGIMSALQVISTLIGSSKAQAGAVSLANERMEHIRSLPYDTVGTVAGIPNGPLPETATKTLNGIVYSERILIAFVDDPKDGTGSSDSNSILADYKIAKVSYSWDQKGTTKTISLLSNIIPQGIETTAGGGTLVVNVFDANVLPVSGASVHIYNNTGTTTINTTRYTNSNGVALFSGAPARAGYQITVTGVGYSTDQTYTASTTNPNPATSHVAVLANQVSTMNFQIDRLSTLAIETKTLPVTDVFTDTFADDSLIATSTGINVTSGEARLLGSSGSYSPTGNLFSDTLIPSPLATWDTLSYEALSPASTSIKVHVYSVVGTSTPVRIPDADLAGNSVGFAPGTIPLTSVSAATYPALVLQASLYSSSTLATPSLSLWNVGYTKTSATLGAIPLTITGSKKIGTNVFKFTKSVTTNSSGNATLANLEWDVYDIIMNNPAYDIGEACKAIPYALAPGVSETLTLTLLPAVTTSLRVAVVNGAGVEVPNATVRLSRGGYDQTVTSSACGQAMFSGGLPVANNYSLTVNAFGYVSQTLSDIVIDGTETLVVTLVAS